MPREIRIESLDVLKAMKEMKEMKERESMTKECEVCWAKDNETNIYEFKNAYYCEQDLERAKVEGWHNA